MRPRFAPSRIIVAIADSIIRNADLTFKAATFVAQHGDRFRPALSGLIGKSVTYLHPATGIATQGTVEALSVDQGKVQLQIADARSCLRPDHRLQPEKRQNTAARPACPPSPCRVRKISLTA